MNRSTQRSLNCLSLALRTWGRSGLQYGPFQSGAQMGLQPLKYAALARSKLRSIAANYRDSPLAGMTPCGRTRPSHLTIPWQTRVERNRSPGRFTGPSAAILRNAPRKLCAGLALQLRLARGPARSSRQCIACRKCKLRCTLEIGASAIRELDWGLVSSSRRRKRATFHRNVAAGAPLHAASPGGIEGGRE